MTLLALAACLHSQASKFAMLKGGRTQLEKSVVVPFSISGSHLIVVDAKLNGITVKMVIDTGGITMIDSSLCTELNLEPEEIGNSGMMLARLDSISLGEVQVLDMKAMVTDFQEKFKMGQYGIRGMIGSDYLRFFLTEIDYNSRQMTFGKVEKLEAQSDKDHLMSMDVILPYLPVVKATVNNTLELKAIVDTGVKYALVIPYKYLEQQDIRGDKNIVESEGMFSSWPFTEKNRNALVKVDQIAFGDLILKDQAVLFADLPNFGNENIMLIGRDFLNDYKTKLNYEYNQIYLHEAPYRQEDIAFSIGVNIMYNGESYEIKGIWKGSPADSLGLKVGDKFSQVNGQSDISEEELYWQLVDPRVKEIKLLDEASGNDITLIKENLLSP